MVFKLGDLVWAKMKGYPHWPGIIIEPTEEPKVKKGHQYVVFFGTSDSKNVAWIPDKQIVPHSQSLIDNYKGKKMRKGLQPAINEIVEHYKSRQPTSDEENIATADEENPAVIAVEETPPPAIVDEETPPDIVDEETPPAFADEENPAAIADKKWEPGPSKRIPKSLAYKYNKSKGSSNKKSFNFGYFGTRHVRFRTNFRPKKSRAVSICQSEKVNRKRKASGSPENQRKQQKLFPRKTPTVKKIGILGFGLFGVNLARNLTASGHDVTVCDRKKDRLRFFLDNKYVAGVKETYSPAYLAQQCDIILSCIEVESEFVDAIHDPNEGILCELDKTKGYVELTNLNKEVLLDVEDEVRKKGARFLDAPFFTTYESIQKGELDVFVSGSEDLFNDCQTIFDSLASKAIFVGKEVGIATDNTLIMNSLQGMMSAILGEGMAAANLLGIAQLDIMSCLSALGYDNPLITALGNNILHNDFKSCPYSLTRQQKAMHRTLKMDDNIQPMFVLATSNDKLLKAKRLKFPKNTEFELMNTDDPSLAYFASKQ